MSAVFAAQYAGRCAACGDRIDPGQDITYADDQTVHATCNPADISTSTPPRENPVCPTCWLTHAGECDR